MSCFSENTSDSDWKDTKTKAKPNGNGKQKYNQKFCEKWLSLFDPWIKRSADDPDKPFCRACQCRLDCNRCHLVRHERTTKHKRNLESLITKGEGAVRKELSVRRERSKYYHQRKRALLAQKQEQQAVIIAQEVDNLNEDKVTPALVIKSDITVEDSAHITLLNHEVEQPEDAAPISAQAGSIVAKATPETSPQHTSVQSNKEGLKLLMQIHQDKNELMESFRELIGTQIPQVPTREKNHVDLFFDSVSSSVKALSPKLIAEAKMRVSQLICELELRGLTEDSANGNIRCQETAMTTTNNYGTLA
ncbi:CG34149 [Drosophila busckii]|uniref:CG34149 n=1 Tax=Drosophila busckii TaxID=30019 RepID=A0A0M3QYF4_DROBS|nr:protein suppressor of variegation 3-7 [Drosophila busckii]ALC47583.1 CG34149 [Drosophila busckii]